MTNKTQVFLVVDLSGSMRGDLEAKQRQVVGDLLKRLATDDASGHEVTVTLIPFSTQVSLGPARRAMSYTEDDVNKLRTGTGFHDHDFGGRTALRDALGAALTRAEGTLDAVPALISVFTDGAENASYQFSAQRIRALIERLEKTGNLTVSIAGPRSTTSHLPELGVPAGNFLAWDGTVDELERAGVATVAAVDSYMVTRGQGVTRSAAFYADPSKLTPQGIKAMTAKVVPTEIKRVTTRMSGRAIADYFGAGFRPGAHFYELIKPEYIQDDKDLIVFIKDQNEYRRGSRAVRILLGLPEVGKIRVRPGPHSEKYKIFVQSSSVNRKVVEGQEMLTV